MSILQERYRPVPMGADEALDLSPVANLGGFLALTSGTITVVDSNGVTVINGLAVTAGIYTPMPFLIGGGGLKSTVTLGGGASGTLGTS